MSEHSPDQSTPAERFHECVRECNLPPQEIEQRLRDIEELLVTLVESVGALDPQILQAMRAQLQILLEELGLQSLKDLPIVYDYLRESAKRRIKPDGYPELRDFWDAFEDLAMSGVGIAKELPSETLTASDVAENAQVDPNLEGRGGLKIAEYLHNLGILMANSYAYQLIFNNSDLIEIGKRWQVMNGRHRAAVLRIMGREMVEETGMNGWIKVRKADKGESRIRRMFTGKR